MFERKWVKKVRYELYFKKLTIHMFSDLKLNIIYNKIEKMVQNNKKFNFLKCLKYYSEITFNQYYKLRSKL